ncbi:Laccase-2 [Acrodontium crateriforme]|uniref:laccase n=1 Tax=Acrodontium crateriforme TaxID=150365 RepID=A0AAQ3MBK7_9PEZI|nr:Laccase-2 [Acrodontium crateriforme]
MVRYTATYSYLMLLGRFATGLASPNIISSSQSQALKRATSACDGNSASDRSVWCDYSTSTDYYNDGPDTGNTVEYWFDIQNTTISPDGVSRNALTINGSIPGPTIIADWGDTVIVHVTNSLANNGSSIHFHGIRQNWTNPMDGVPSITQCPTAPGDSITYTWKAVQYGSSWYHSHFALQAWEGIFGGILINGPATADYDEDLGVLFIQDWSHETADSLYSSAQTNGPPTLETGLINGTNVWDDGGSRFEMSVESGSTYRLRLVNPSIDSFMDFSIDNHTLQVIAMDFVPITPYTTDVIGLGPGQRYDVLITADQSSVASDFWLRAVPDTFCSENDNTDDIKGIVHYGSSTGTPTTSAWTTDDAYLACADPPVASLVPFVSKDAGATAGVTAQDEVTVGQASGTNTFKWYLNDVTFLMEWDDPTALQVLNGNTTFTTQAAVIELPTADEWMYLIIEQTNAIPHPIHLHGHDFYILASGSGTYDSSSVSLQTSNPPRRDVAMLPASGYLVLAFQADNPGVWLTHCHIGWHTEEGFALQFVERYDEIADLYNATALSDSCATWSTYDTEAGIEQDDSGI